MTNPTVNPSEVGWQFVPQYYTFVNKQPHRLHCFYTKASTFIHGTEGEDGKPCYGQQVRLLPSQDASYFHMFAFPPALLFRVAPYHFRLTSAMSKFPVTSCISCASHPPISGGVHTFASSN